MKAVVWTKYGPPEVLQLRELAKPVPKENEILIRIHATTVTTGDCEMRSLRLPFYFSLVMRLWLGFLKPRGTTIPGTELAGEVEAVGKAVRLFKPGDAVFGSAGLTFGTCAEYMCLPEEPGLGVLALKPANLSYAEAAAVAFGANDALHFLRQARIGRGQKVLIIGAGGSIGTFAVQLARTYGAEVTAVDGAAKLEVLRTLGAEHVIDYTRGDYLKKDQSFDVIFDTVGKSSFSGCIHTLKPGGFYLLANPGLADRFRAPWASMRSGRKVISEVASRNRPDLLFLKDLLEKGTLHAVIDRSYPLEQIVAAHRYVDSGQKTGNVVILI